MTPRDCSDEPGEATASPALGLKSKSSNQDARATAPNRRGLFRVTVISLLALACCTLVTAAPLPLDPAPDEAPSYSRALSLFKKRMRSKDADTRTEAALDLARVSDIRAAETLFEYAIDTCARKNSLEKEHARRVEDLVKFERSQARSQRGQNPGDFADNERRHLRGQVRRVKSEWRKRGETEAALVAGTVRCIASLGDEARAESIAMLRKLGLEGRDACAFPTLTAVAAALPPELGVPLLAEMLADETEVPIRVLLVEALTSYRPEDASDDAVKLRDELLGKALAHPAWQVRATAVEGFLRAPSRRGVGLLIEALGGEPGRLIDDLLRALPHITGVNDLRTPEAWADWWAANGETFLLPAAPTAADTGEANPAAGAASAVGGRHDYGTSFYGIDTRSRRIVFVLDTSGSMDLRSQYSDGTKLDVAKAELETTLRSLRPPAHINLVFFGDTIQAWRRHLVALDDKTRADALRFIDDVKAAGGTNLFDGLRAAHDVSGLDLIDAEFVEGADTVYLLSDGEPNRGILVDADEILAEVARWNRIRKMRIHTIGLGTEHNAELMKGLAALTGGRYLVRR